MFPVEHWKGVAADLIIMTWELGSCPSYPDMSHAAKLLG